MKQLKQNGNEAMMTKEQMIELMRKIPGLYGKTAAYGTAFCGETAGTRS